MPTNPVLLHEKGPIQAHVEGYETPMFLRPAIIGDAGLPPSLTVRLSWDEDSSNAYRMPLPRVSSDLDIVAMFLATRIIHNFERFSEERYLAAVEVAKLWGQHLTGDNVDLIARAIGTNLLNELMTSPLTEDEVFDLIYSLVEGVIIDVRCVARAIETGLLTWRHVYLEFLAPPGNVIDYARTLKQRLAPYEQYIQGYAKTIDTPRIGPRVSMLEEAIAICLTRDIEKLGDDIVMGMAYLSLLAPDAMRAEIQRVAEWCHKNFKGPRGYLARRSTKEYSTILSRLVLTWPTLPVTPLDHATDEDM